MRMGIKKIKEYKLPVADEIPQNKISWKFDKNNAVLLIHDMQQYFLEAYDSQSLLYKSLLQNIKTIKTFCVENNIPVVYSAQPKGQTDEQRGLLLDFWGKGIPQNGVSEEIIEQLQPDINDIIITKWRYSAFENTELHDVLKRLDKNQLIICGIYAHIGCLTTAVTAFMRGIKPFFVADAMADFSKEKHLMALEYISQLAGKVVTIKDIVES